MTDNHSSSKPMTTRGFISLVLLLFFFTSIKTFAQEKRNFLQHRYDGTTEIITKTTTDKSLKKLQQKLERQGIYFRYKHIKRNHENEITRIKITIKNKVSDSSSKWDNNTTIPSIKVGEINGIVFATSSQQVSLPKKE